MVQGFFLLSQNAWPQIYRRASLLGILPKSNHLVDIRSALGDPLVVVLRGLQTQPINPLTCAAMAFDSHGFRQFNSLWSSRIQGVSVPLGQTDPRLAGRALESLLLVSRDTQSKRETAGLAGRQLRTPHAFGHGGSVAQKNTLCSTK